MKTHLVICVALLSLATAGLMQLARLWLEQLPPDSLWQVPVAVLPLLPLLTVGLWMERRRFLRFDELQRRLHLMALMFGSSLLVIDCGVGIMLEELAGRPPLPLLGALLVHGIGYALALALLWRRYA